MMTFSLLENSVFPKEDDDSVYYYCYERSFPEAFQAYVQEQGLHHLDCRHRGCFSGCFFWSPQNELSHGGDDGKIIREKLQNLSKTDKIPGSCLIQVWRAVEIDGKRCLITKNQPFIISIEEEKATISEQLCTYRVKTSMMNYGIFNEEEQDVGVVDRVFRNQRMEFTPDISYYSSQEHSQRDFALSFGIKGSVAIPLSGSFGVIEIVWVEPVDEHLLDRDLPKFLAYLQGNSLIAPRCKGLCGQYDDRYASLYHAVSEINEVVEVVNKSCDILFAQTWILCKQCNSLSTTERVHPKFVTSSLKGNKTFLGAQSLRTHQNGKGVVASAVWFNNLVFCENVADFSITEYPLAHFARHCDLSACFAICLRSKHTRNLVYVLELFLAPNFSEQGSQMATLVKLFVQMRQNFRTLKVASGEEIGENLSIQIIDAKCPHKLGFFETGNIDLTEHSVIENNYMELSDIANTPLKQERATMLVEKQLLIGEKSFNDLRGKEITELDRERSTPPKECIINPVQTTRKNGTISISLEDLKEQDGKPRKVAAQALGISVATFKRKCREHEILRWQNTRTKSLVNVKVKCGDNKFIEFELSKSSRYDELHQKVVQRLKKEVEICYENNQNEKILVACDEDLHSHISYSRSAGNNVLEFTVELTD